MWNQGKTDLGLIPEFFKHDIARVKQEIGVKLFSGSCTVRIIGVAACGVQQDQ